MKTKIIFLGNGLLADSVLEALKNHFEIIFHAKKKEDLDEVIKLRKNNPETPAVLASFGILIPNSILELFEPEGILNVHPSLLPKYRGPAPIEQAILDGETDFSVSIMKLAKEMDAGPIYWQETLPSLPLEKTTIYTKLAKAGANWLIENLEEIHNLTPKAQVGTASYTKKLTKEMGKLNPKDESSNQIFRKIVAFQGFPKAKYPFFGINCAILEAKESKKGEKTLLPLICKDGTMLEILRLQPDGKKPMDAKSFLNGYKR